MKEAIELLEELLYKNPWLNVKVMRIARKKRGISKHEMHLARGYLQLESVTFSNGETYWVDVARLADEQLEE